MTLLLLDDFPFLIMRLVCIIAYDLKNYSSYFFTAKNLLVLALDVNRILALYKQQRKVKNSSAKPTEMEEVLADRRISLSHIRR